MTPLIYFDNSFIRILISDPKKWNTFFDNFTPLFGEFYTPFSASYFLFFEYIGFAKDNIKKPVNETLQLVDICSLQKAEKDIAYIGKQLEAYFQRACIDIKAQLLKQQDIIKELLNTRIRNEEVVARYENSRDLRQLIFGDLVFLLNNNYPLFVEQASLYLAWDFFCNVNPEGISIDILRQCQFGIWQQFHKEHIHLPFGKIIDDFKEFNLSKKNKFKGYEDMVDSEILTYLIMGSCGCDINAVGPVNVLTFDSVSTMQSRIEIALRSMVSLETALNVRLINKLGKAYCFNEDSMKINQIIEPQVPISLPEISTNEIMPS